MAQITTQLLVSQQTHPSDSSVQTVTGSAVKGNGYYGQADGRHTALFSVTGFTGTITIQGSLVTSPGSTDWADITVFSDSTTQEDGNTAVNFTGNFVWLRAVVEYTDGTVNSVRINY
jgi:hypothetical protein